jgi:hypothetical protein
MVRYFLTAVVLLILISCSHSEKRNEWYWDAQIFNPYFFKEGEGQLYSGSDTLRRGERFRARLYKGFTDFKDSIGDNLIKEFKGYFVEIAVDTSRRPGIGYGFKRINNFIHLKEDTAFVDIPTDSLFKYNVAILNWRAGYRVIFTDNSDTTYMVGGKWILE